MRLRALSRPARPCTTAARAGACGTRARRAATSRRVHELRLDCDNDVVLLKVEQLGHEPGEAGIACHTGRHSCFFQLLKDGAWTTVEPVLKDPEQIYK